MLTALQQRIAELFFGLDEAAGFALAGGAALIGPYAMNLGTAGG